MTATAALVLLSWLLVVALSREPAPSIALIPSVVLALGASLLGVAHAAAFVARRMVQDLVIPDRSQHAVVEPRGAAPRQGGCGCGGGVPASRPVTP